MFNIQEKQQAMHTFVRLCRIDPRKYAAMVRELRDHYTSSLGVNDLNYSIFFRTWFHTQVLACVLEALLDNCYAIDQPGVAEKEEKAKLWAAFIYKSARINSKYPHEKAFKIMMAQATIAINNAPNLLTIIK